MGRYDTFLCALGILLLLSCQRNFPPEVQQAYADLPERVDFNYHVKPILSDNCFFCHGPDAQNRKAELRLDLPAHELGVAQKEKWLQALQAGSAHQSELVHRILSQDEENVMPPPESHLSLTEIEKATLIKWIEEGAEYKRHWSFIPPTKADLPPITTKEWPENEIDYFTLAQLEILSLHPREKAQKETLIRRVSFGLRGLPPTAEEVENFLQDTTSHAYEKMVDQYLHSPAYGERMAAYWLDVARYADSDGYLDDKHRDFSPYRDWVIKAFNTNMPYNQFTTWQLAGDLVEEPTQESILATAFNRLHRKNSEAGIVFEEFRTEYVADRTITAGKAFMGLTLECARCHDHKYDPISQEDFYELFAFFNRTNELGTAVYGPDQTPGPSLMLSTEEQEKITTFLHQTIQKQEKELQSRQQNALPKFEQWLSNPDHISASLALEQKKHLVAHLPFDQFRQTQDPKRLTSPTLGNRTSPTQVKEPQIRKGWKGEAVFIQDYTFAQLPEKVGWFDRYDPFSVSLAIYPDTLYEDVGIFMHCEELRLGLKGYSLHLERNKPKFILSHSWPSNAIQVRLAESIPIRKWTQLTITYDGSSKAAGIKMYVNGQEAEVEIDIDHLYKGILFEPNIHTYGFQGFTLGKFNKIKQFMNGGIDELQLFDRALSALEVQYLVDKKVVEKGIGQFQNPVFRKQLQEFYVQQVNEESQPVEMALRKSRNELNAHLDSIREIMVMKDVIPDRPTFILERGMYDAPGEEVQVGIPDAVARFPDTLPKNRLGLAQWLFAPDNPLTARVFVNRMWKMHFGRGIVSTLDDFGNQGALPSHPQLLDYLAVYFRESGWDIQALHKKMLMSATYQQSSKLSPELLEQDPDNIYLARGPRQRMTAEMVRDNALAISHLLSEKIGGPSVYPYQPEGLWDEISNKKWRYPYLQAPGEGLYRRSVYTIWKRTAPPPSMLIFDAPDRGMCTVDRTATSTPLQALVLLNDPQFLEAARVTAERLLEKYPEDVSQQLLSGYQLATGRKPAEEELAILHQFYREEWERFNREPEAAQEYIEIGEFFTHPHLDPIQTASLATVINGMMNTVEGYTIQ